MAKFKAVSILECDHEEAREFFLKSNSYCNADLPSYFDFSPLLNELSGFLESNDYQDQVNRKAVRDLGCDQLNHIIYTNKNGKLDWRPLTLVHPVIYVRLVHTITEEENWNHLKKRFKSFSKGNGIECHSLPFVTTNQQKDKAAQIIKWWEGIEQKSIELSLEYDHLTLTDISDCYGSIYTHSLAWAINKKSFIKKGRNRSNYTILGNVVDSIIQDMSNGQTNGIPQGSIIMDFLAEIVLGYVDQIIGMRLKKLNIDDYKILRFRDDYRVFTTDQRQGEDIVKVISESLVGLGMKLNPAKTQDSSDIISQSIKEDKLSLLEQNFNAKTLQKRLLLIYRFSKKHPNSSALIRPFLKLHKRISKQKRIRESVKPLIAIITEISMHNPRTYPLQVGMLSSLLTVARKSKEDTRELIDLVISKINRIANKGILEIWLQRVGLAHDFELQLKEPLCLIAKGEKYELWDNSWLKTRKLKLIFSDGEIINTDILADLDKTIDVDEIDIFKTFSL